jgi:hypothetical protein
MLLKSGLPLATDAILTQFLPAKSESNFPECWKEQLMKLTESQPQAGNTSLVQVLVQLTGACNPYITTARTRRTDT